MVGLFVLRLSVLGLLGVGISVLACCFRFVGLLLGCLLLSSGWCLCLFSLGVISV